jgi:hypothetical protein
MPRKIQSSGEPTQNQKTSLKRALEPKDAGHQKKSGDGGPWAGSGRKTVEHSQGPEIARKATKTGRGAKTRTAMRTMKANHPNHG